MRLVLYLIIGIILVTPLNGKGQIPQNMQTEILQGVNELKQQIVEQQILIDEAIRNKEDPSVIKEMEDQLSMLKQQLSLVEKITESVTNIPQENFSQLIDNDSNDLPKFPERNPALLKSLPAINSKEELTIYANDLHNHFLKKADKDLITSFREIEKQLEGDVDKMASAAIATWYNEAPVQSILLLTKAAMQSKASDLTINNLGALLNLGGLEIKALPILKYLVTLHPQNAMILNNLGQAYAGVGELNEAMLCFGRCFQLEPNHPQANFTAGEIELSRGNQAAANQYFKNSLNGAFTEEATRRVKFVEPDIDLDNYLKHNIRMPEYFNENKYNVPPQCQNVNEAEELTAVYRGYHEMVDNLHNKYYDLGMEYMEKTKQNLIKRSNDAMAMKKLSNPPFIIQAMNGWDQMMKKYMSDGEWLMTMDRDYEIRVKQIYDNFRANPGGPDCASMTAATNKYLREMADVTKAWQLKHTAFNKKYINQQIYWSFLNSFSSDEFKLKFYEFVKNYLQEMRSIAKTELIGPPCSSIEPRNIPAAETEILFPNCPIDLELKLIVGKIALNCERFSFGGGEIIKFKYEKNFPSKQSTLSIGIGATFEVGGNFGGGFKGSASVDLGENVFITLDGNNNFSDFGMNAKAEASVNLSKESSLDLGNPIAQEVTRSSDIFGAKAGLECSAGVNSGLTVSGGSSLNPGPLKGFF